MHCSESVSKLYVTGPWHEYLLGGGVHGINTPVFIFSIANLSSIINPCFQWLNVHLTIKYRILKTGTLYVFKTFNKRKNAGGYFFRYIFIASWHWIEMPYRHIYFFSRKWTSLHLLIFLSMTMYLWIFKRRYFTLLNMLRFEHNEAPCLNFHFTM